MCGRFTLQARWERILAEFAADFVIDVADNFDWQPRFNLAPTQNILAVREQAGRFEGCKLRWGLIPGWAKDVKIGASLMNARSETVADKPSFRAAFKRRRCLIPADGFYEWQKTSASSSKLPHYITVGQNQLFAFAGIWESWQSPEGAKLETCSILTTSPNALMQTLHDRMPVILPEAAYRIWLTASTDPHVLQNLLVPYPAEAMQARPVSNYVNNVRHEGPACVAE